MILKKKIIYYMNPKNDSKRKKIEKQGMNFVRNNHSCEVRVKQMTKTITDQLGIK
jgi:spore maturation protein CgeB